MKVFILEDDETRIREFEVVCKGLDVTVCRTAEQARARFQPPYDIILLDHDLGGMMSALASDDPNYWGKVEPDQEESGLSFVKWIQENHPHAEPTGFTVIHSYNPEGARSMAGVLVRDLGWHNVARIPFGRSVLDTLKVAAAQPDSD